MFDLRVTDYEEAMRLVQARWATHVVCAMVTRLPDYGDAAFLHLPMDDILRPSPGLILPTLDHVRQMLAFTQNLSSDDRLLVYCHRGLNRSPAMAIAVLLQRGMAFSDAYRSVAKLCPNLAPNRLLMSYIEWQINLLNCRV
jgi:predicted protein tyrosine phosphatase